MILHVVFGPNLPDVDMLVARGVLEYLRRVIQILLRPDPRRRVVRIVFAPPALEYPRKARPEPGVLPPLQAAPVDVAPERERARAWGPDAQPVEVRHLCPERDARGGVRRVPERAERVLRAQEGGVRACGELRGGVVELVEDDVVFRGAWGVQRIRKDECARSEACS